MRLVISVGESSGDFLAAHLVEGLKKTHPKLEVVGIAGPLMIQAGVKPWYMLDELNVMGLQEVLVHLPRIWHLRRSFRKKIIDWQPDAFIGVDAPDFNLGLARWLRARGMITMHYVSPSIWAWRKTRAKKISQSVDQLLTLFPFEPPLYAPYGLEAHCVGHPLADVIDAQLKKESTVNASTQIALLPGSRWSEIQRHVPLLIETVSHFTDPGSLSWIMPVMDPMHESKILSEWGERLAGQGIKVVCGDTRSVVQKSTVALAASGTVTLETFLLRTPQVVFYRLSPITYWLARQLRLIKTRWVSLPNILTQKALVPELIQHEATPKTLGRALHQWLSDDKKRKQYQEASDQWRERLLANDRAAQAVIRGLQ